MNQRRTLTAAVAALLGTVGFLTAAPPASAGLPVLATGHVDISYTSTTFTVCASGRLDDGTGISGLWLFNVYGARTDATPINMTNLSAGESFSQCYAVPKDGNANGAFTATLSFATVGTSSPNIVPDFTAVAAGVATWNPSGATSIGT